MPPGQIRADHNPNAPKIEDVWGIGVFAVVPSKVRAPIENAAFAKLGLARNIIERFSKDVRASRSCYGSPGARLDVVRPDRIRGVRCPNRSQRHQRARRIRRFVMDGIGRRRGRTLRARCDGGCDQS